MTSVHLFGWLSLKAAPAWGVLPVFRTGDHGGDSWGASVSESLLFSGWLSRRLQLWPPLSLLGNTLLCGTVEALHLPGFSQESSATFPQFPINK